MNLSRFGQLESWRDIGTRLFQRLAWCGIALCALYLFKLPMKNGAIAFATIIVLGGGSLADAYRLKQRRKMQNNPSHHTTESRAEARLPAGGER